MLILYFIKFIKKTSFFQSQGHYVEIIYLYTRHILFNDEV